MRFLGNDPYRHPWRGRITHALPAKALRWRREWESWGFQINVAYQQLYTPGKLTWNLKMEVWKVISFSIGWLSGSRLIFRGVNVGCISHYSNPLCLPMDKNKTGSTMNHYSMSNNKHDKNDETFVKIIENLQCGIDSDLQIFKLKRWSAPVTTWSSLTGGVGGFNFVLLLKSWLEGLDHSWRKKRDLALTNLHLLQFTYHVQRFIIIVCHIFT